MASKERGAKDPSQIGAAVGARYQRWAAFVFALLIPVSTHRPIAPSPAPEILDLYVRPGLYLSDLAVCALLLANLLGPNKRCRHWGDHRLTLPLLALVGLAFVTIPAALSRVLAGYTAIRWLLAAGVYLSLVRGNLPVEFWAKVFVTGLGVQAVIGLGQTLHQGPLGLPGEFALEPARSGAAILQVDGQRWLRAYGLTFHPNVLGGFMALGLLLSLPLLTRWHMRLWWWLMGQGLVLSFSRSAWLATALVLPPTAAWLAWRQPNLRRPLSVTLAGAVLATLLSGVLLAGQFRSRVRPTETATEFRSLNERGGLIAVALDTIADRPLTGVGAGNFPVAMLATDTRIIPQPVHKVPLLLAAEVGVIGGFLWIWLWLTPGLAVNPAARGQNPWLVVVVSAGFALGIIGLWDDYPWALNAGRLCTITVLSLISRTLFSHSTSPGRAGKRH